MANDADQPRAFTRRHHFRQICMITLPQEKNNVRIGMRAAFYLPFYESYWGECSYKKPLRS